METLDYSRLSSLQDKALSVIFERPHAFYLTGGTALHRFIYNERYSDDLDLFANASKVFAFEFAEILANLKKSFSVLVQIDGYGFKRIMIKEKDLELQVDFVNDLEYRYGNPIIINGFVIDHTINVLINKITAILSRDEAKDVFDLVTICKNNSFNWNEIISLAQNKAAFTADELIVRLKEFPINFLGLLKTVNKVNNETFENDINKIMSEIANLEEHCK